MSVKFCIVSGTARRSLTCGMDIPTEPAETPIELGAMGHLQYKIYSPEFLQKRIKVAERPPHTWTSRIICTLAPIESLFCISFIPTDPYKKNILLVMRMKNLDEKAESYQVFCQDYPAIKFMLPQEGVDQIFDISNQQISQTVAQFDASLSPILEKVVKYLEQESILKGIALTFTNQDGVLRTYIWLKSYPTCPKI